MSDKSALFVSALQVLAHAIELYSNQESENRIQRKQMRLKFIVLHLANAVELILKDYLVDLNQSIFKDGQPNFTYSTRECLKSVERKNKLRIRRARLELLIADRDEIQHRFGFPSTETVYDYIKDVLELFEELFDKHYGIDLVETLGHYLNSEQLEVIGKTSDCLCHLKRLFRITEEAAVVEAYELVRISVLEAIQETSDENTAAPQSSYHQREDIKRWFRQQIDAGLLEADIISRFENLRKARNAAAHIDVVEEPTYLESALECALKIIGVAKQPK